MEPVRHVSELVSPDGCDSKHGALRREIKPLVPAPRHDLPSPLPPDGVADANHVSFVLANRI